jgi:MipA family protein
MIKYAIKAASAAAIISFSSALCLQAQAQQQRAPYDLDIEIGAAAGFAPSYEGARSVRATAFPLITMHFIRLPFLGEFGGKPDQGWSFSPSFRIVGERKQSDDSRLLGLGNIAAAYEFGGKVAYRWQDIRVFALARKGFGGHTGWTGAIGADYIANLSDRWNLEFGPRAEFASASYMNKYFGVNAAQSAASGYGLYTANAGLKGAGAETKLVYKLTDNWSVVGQANFIRLVGDAGKAPLVRAGTPNMFSASVGLTYRFTTRFSR